MNHYRTHWVYVRDTGATRNTDSVAWLPNISLVPKYATLPPGLFIDEPVPTAPQQPTHAPTARPLSNSEGGHILHPQPTADPCQPNDTQPPSPTSVDAMPRSETNTRAQPPTIVATAPRFIRLTHPSTSEGVLLPLPHSPAAPPAVVPALPPAVPPAPIPDVPPAIVPQSLPPSTFNLLQQPNEGYHGPN